MTSEVPETKKDPFAAARAAKKVKAAERKAAAEAQSRVMDPVEVREKRARLLQELADLPSDPAPKGALPGTTIKDGLGDDKVPWTPAVLRDYCNRGVVVDGVPFGWKEIIGVPEHRTVSWNGLVYLLRTGEVNKVPSVHYAVYMQSLEDQRRERQRWEAPANPGRYDGYMAAPHIMGVGPLEPRGE